MLAILEKSGRGEGTTPLIDDLPLFSSAASPARQPMKPNAVVERLAALRPDELTPREALEMIYALKAVADEKD